MSMSEERFAKRVYELGRDMQKYFTPKVMEYADSAVMDVDDVDRSSVLSISTALALSAMLGSLLLAIRDHEGEEAMQGVKRVTDQMVKRYIKS